jgi:nucleotide-binding universal stress UspA family protein
MFERILFAVDRSPSCERAARVTTDLAKKYGADVMVLHVREELFTKFGTYETEASADASEIVDDVVRGLKDEGVSVRGELREAPSGRVPRAILEAMADHDAGLLVMGSGDGPDWGGLFVEGVTHRVLRIASCPVLVVR